MNDIEYLSVEDPSVTARGVSNPTPLIVRRIVSAQLSKGIGSGDERGEYICRGHQGKLYMGRRKTSKDTGKWWGQ